LNTQTGKITALYYRVAHKQTLGLYLDNQMQTLLCYANEQGLDKFALYADIGQNGLTLDRPALNTLNADIEAGHIEKLVIQDVSRLARGFILAETFIEWAQAQDVEIISIMDGELTSSLYADVIAQYRSLLKGGRRV